MTDPAICIRACPMEHHFLGSIGGGDTCPVCDLPGTSWYEIRVGDCIACGALCNGAGYACDKPRPLPDPGRDHPIEETT
jgi:hypothetical protein